MPKIDGRADPSPRTGVLLERLRREVYCSFILVPTANRNIAVTIIRDSHFSHETEDSFTFSYSH